MDDEKCGGYIMLTLRVAPRVVRPCGTVTSDRVVAELPAAGHHSYLGAILRMVLCHISPQLDVGLFRPCATLCPCEVR